MWLILCTYAVPILFGFINRVFVPALGPGLGLQSPQALVSDHNKLNHKEEHALQVLREMTADITPELDDYLLKDHFFMRFLRARNMDVNAANQMLRNAVKWRKENRIDSIVNETTFEFAVPAYSFEGFDFEGRPVIIFRILSVDIRKLLLSGKRETLMRWWDQMLERGLDELRKISASKHADSPEITQFIAILDMDGFSLPKHFCLQCPGMFIDWLKDYENYFPDLLKYFLFINTFRSAVPLLEVFRPTMSQSTQRALKIFGPQKKEWADFLLSIIPANQLPVRYGGTKVA